MEGTQSDRGAMLAAISDAISALHREAYGRGATKTRTTLSGDVLTTVLEDIYTPAEHTLLGAGNFEIVNQARSAFQDTMRPRFVAVVEEKTGRRVRAFASQIHVDPDLAIETFILDSPNGRESGTRRADGDV